MSQQLFIAFLVFAVVMFFTPGPNNVMLLASGLNFGFRRTLPHVAGVTVGFAFMVAVTGLGLGAIFTAYPVLQIVLKYAGAAYLVYLAIAIARAAPPSPGELGAVRTSLQSLVKSPCAIRAFNVFMAALLLASLYPVLSEL